PARQRSTSTISGSEARTDTGIAESCPPLRDLQTPGRGAASPSRRHEPTRIERLCIRGPIRRSIDRGDSMLLLLLILLLPAVAFGGFFLFTLKVAVVVAIILLVIGLLGGWSFRGGRRTAL